MSCDVCHSASDAPYTCPRCNVRYCSVPCYKQHSGRCTEGFYRENVAQELGSVVASDEEKRRMVEILQRMHDQQLEEEEEEGSAASSEGDEDELVPGLSVARAVAVAEGDITAEDLTAEELQAFHEAVASGEAAEAVAAWLPWWHSQEASQLELSPCGTRLVESLDPLAAAVPNNNAQRLPDGVEGPGSEASCSALPPPPPRPLPLLATLTSRPPSPVMGLHLLDLLYSYCLVLRLYNGDYTADATDAASLLLSVSGVLIQESQGSAADAGSGGTPPGCHDLLVECVIRACGMAPAGQAAIPRGFAVSVLWDVSMAVQLGRSVVVTALMDLTRLVECAAREGEEEARGGVQGRVKGRKAWRRQLGLAGRKILFFMAWVNEYGAAQLEQLAVHAAACFETHKATLQPFP